MFVGYLPGPVGDGLRRLFWRKRLKFMGKRVRIDVGVHFQNPRYISLDDHCWIDRGVMIMAGIDVSNREKFVIRNKNYKGEPATVHVGKNVHLGPYCIISGISAGVYISDNCGLSAGCKIYAFSHHYKSVKYPNNEEIYFSSRVPHEHQSMIEGSVQLSENVGLSLNVVVLPGSFIPARSFVKMNSVIHANRFSENSIIEGNPATVRSKRYITEAPSN